MGTTNTKRTNKKQSSDGSINIRAVLAVLVIIYHSSMIYTYPGRAYVTHRHLAIGGPGTPVAAVIGVSFVSMMPLFFALAGSSMVYTLRKSTSYAVLLRKKFYRLVIPWLFIGLCWSIPLRFAAHHPQFKGVSFGRILWETFITGNFSDNLWFLQVLFLMYVVMGLPYHLFKLTDRGDIAAVVWAVIVFAAAVLGGHALEAHNATSKAVSSFIAYLPFFVAGLLLHRQQDRLREAWVSLRVRIAIIVVLAVVYAATVVIALRGADGLTIMYARSIACMPVPIAIAMLIPKRTNWLLKTIGKNLMALYLMHLPLAYLSFAYWPDINPALMLAINIVGFATVVMLIAELLRRLGLGVLLGEKGYNWKTLLGGADSAASGTAGAGSATGEAPATDEIPTAGEVPAAGEPPTAGEAPDPTQRP
ncbi:acyltransferase family protein [Bifidobacterium leontopitheci]|uniref:Acyltransferase n=1 Tax=Bifidobacterium leontopitheci TaxID=2650774 RepID=A0A6I1GM37_9BIFI|nr:acyltransferase [Bifidobacterium leontopitheci]KAB7790459.1 acyltransferase [Bifidobacterium leontopitheci]